MIGKVLAQDQAPAESCVDFQIGDLAVYPAHGVGQIESVESRIINGTHHDFYIMKILDNGMVIMIPTANVQSVGLRPVINGKEVPAIFDLLKEKKDDIHDNQTWNRRYKEYMDKIKSGSLFDVAEVFRDLYCLKLTKDLSFGERKLLDTSKTLLLRELCTALEKEETVVWETIQEFFIEEEEGTNSEVSPA